MVNYLQAEFSYLVDFIAGLPWDTVGIPALIVLTLAVLFAWAAS